MDPTLDVGRGSIKVGSTGTISALMSKELGPLTNPVSHSKSRTNEASSSRATIVPFKNHQKGPETRRKVKSLTRRSRTHQIPMLATDDNISTDATPVRRPKPIRRGLVDIVDIKCGGPERKWANPIKDHLKKLNFSKLSESIV